MLPWRGWPGRRERGKPEPAAPPPMKHPDPAPSTEQLQGLPTPALFRSAFGAPAQRQRLEQRMAADRERQAFESLEARRQWFAAQRAAQREAAE